MAHRDRRTQKRDRRRALAVEAANSSRGSTRNKDQRSWGRMGGSEMGEDGDFRSER